MIKTTYYNGCYLNETSNDSKLCAVYFSRKALVDKCAAFVKNAIAAYEMSERDAAITQLLYIRSYGSVFRVNRFSLVKAPIK